jgi:hypothetical protein
MEHMTLREAAERSSRSITTLRRYIRSGRLHAEKRDGRFGPEYYVSTEDLIEAGLDPETWTHASRNVPGRSVPEVRRTALPAPFRAQESVPLGLYHEILMKHEQLLVQYGMLRAGGLREDGPGDGTSMRALEQSRAEVARVKDELDAERRSHREAMDGLRKELEGREVEVAALQEKVRALEMMTRNSVTNEAIDRQFQQLHEQARKVDALQSRRKWTADERTAWRPASPPESADH